MKDGFTIGVEDDPELLNPTTALRIPSHLEQWATTSKSWVIRDLSSFLDWLLIPFFKGVLHAKSSLQAKLPAHGEHAQRSQLRGSRPFHCLSSRPPRARRIATVPLVFKHSKFGGDVNAVCIEKIVVGARIPDGRAGMNALPALGSASGQERSAEP